MKTKSANLLAKGYELIDGITVPVGTSNIDLNVEGKEPQNAQKLTIVVGNEKINMFVFRPSNRWIPLTNIPWSLNRCMPDFFMLMSMLTN